MPTCHASPLVRAAIVMAAWLAVPAAAAQLEEGQDLPTGQKITPTAARGSLFQPLDPDLPPPFEDFVAGHAVATAVSPDGRTLLILTSGYNRNGRAEGGSDEYVFVYDISAPTPVKRQVLRLPNTFNGIAWNPSGLEFYVSGGVDDNVHVFERGAAGWAEAAVPIPLGHATAPGWGVGPLAAGLAVDAAGQRLVVANLCNDSLSIVDLQLRQKTHEVELRPGKIEPGRSGVPGGEYPFWVAIRGNGRAYVSSQRDREIVVVDLAAPAPVVVRRIRVNGQPNKMVLNRAGSRLFAALDNRDAVAVIDTGSGRILEEIETTAPEEIFANRRKLKGSNPNSLALSPDERSLYVTNGGMNNVAVIRLQDRRDGPESHRSRVVGLIPTGWYPHSVSVSRGGSRLYVVNGKSVAGPNPQLYAGDQYVMQLLKAGFLTLPVPSSRELGHLTRQVARNNRFPGATRESEMMAFLRRRIRHVIYVVKENRTYDQVLGDLEKGNGDPSLTLFGEAISPNHHQLARQFVTLDNFHQSGAVSADGWNWAVAARTTDFTEKTVPVNYGGRGLSYDWHGAGFLWNAALRAGLSVRHYGQFTDWNLYYSPPPAFIPLSRTPFADGIVQAHATDADLQPHTDRYYRGFDMKLPDYWLFKEWEREFDQYIRNRNLPRLTMLAHPHDHFGDFGSAIDGVNTPDTQMADNDYALALMVQKVANSPYKHNTLIFVTEDDAQDGPDHVDAQRTLGYVIGPYVKQGPVISRRYVTVNMLKTIEEILGIEPLGLYDGLAAPMADVFDPRQGRWSYTARLPEVLCTTELPIADCASRAGASGGPLARPRHDSAYWAAQTSHLDFKTRDNPGNTARFNRILWNGLKGEDVPYPVVRHGRDLSQDRSGGR